MAAGISVATAPGTVLRSSYSPFLGPKPVARALRISPSLQSVGGILRLGRRRSPNLTVCFVLEDEKLRGIQESEEGEASGGVGRAISLAESVAEKVAEKMARKKSERLSYLVAAVMSSFGVTSMAIMAVYYRFAWQMEVQLQQNSPSPFPFFLQLFHFFKLSQMFWRRGERYLSRKCWAHLLSPSVLP